MKAAIAKMIVMVCVVMISCSPVKIISTESTAGFALSNYKTFEFFKMESGGVLDPKFNERLDFLRSEIGRQLTARGLSQATGDADLLINIGVVVEEKIQTRQTDFRTDARYSGQRNYSWESEEVEVGRYREGTVTLHLVERKKNAMVWRGVANGIVPNKDKKVKETIAIGVEELIKKVN